MPEAGSDARNVLVTGGTGFIGAALVASLAREGRRVWALVRPDSPKDRLDELACPVERLHGDISDLASMRRAIAHCQPDTIFHLAGDTSVRRFDGSWDIVDRAMRVNVLGTLALVRAAAESSAPVRCVIRAGGLEEYGAGPAPSDEDQREQPSSPYSASQVSATHWCQMLQPTLPFALVTLRPALVYGPGQSSDFLIPALILSLLRGKRFAISHGQQIRDYVHVDDVTRAFRMAAGAAASLRGRAINISSGNQFSVATVAHMIATAMGAAHLLDVGSGPARPADLANVSGSNALARRLLGWEPELPLDRGLRQTIDWYKGRTVQ